MGIRRKEELPGGRRGSTVRGNKIKDDTLMMAEEEKETRSVSPEERDRPGHNSLKAAQWQMPIPSL